MAEPSPPTTATAALTPSVRRHELETSGDGAPRTLYLLPTAHVSERSVEEVRATLAALWPDQVAVELCPARYTTLTDRDTWRRLDIFQVIRSGRAPLLLASIALAVFQRRIAAHLGTAPGAEMMAAIAWARSEERELLLIDRDIQVTLRRTWRGLSWWRRLRTLGQLLIGLFSSADDLDAETIERLKSEHELQDMLSALARALPEVKTTLIDERDTVMAENLRARAAGTTVAVIGAGHLAGILERLVGDPVDPAPLLVSPRPGPGGRILGWSIPLLLAATLVYVLTHAGLQETVTSAWIWVLVHAVLAGLGVLLVLGHPLAIAVSALTAPFTSLNPLVASGWFAGLAQAWARRPTVRDLEEVTLISNLRDFWRNPLCRILLVVALSNLGSSAATFVAGAWIAARTL